MRPRSPGDDALLNAEAAGFIRQALVSAAHALAWAGAHAGPDYHQAVAGLTERSGRGRTAGQLYYDACLAVDYLDFAPSPEGEIL